MHIISEMSLLKIPGLDGTGKMGKSEGNGIFLSDTPQVIRKKVMSAVTDAGPTEPGQTMSEPVRNLFTIMNVVSDPTVVKYFTEKHASCEIRYGDLKKQLAEDIIKATDSDQGTGLMIYWLIINTLRKLSERVVKKQGKVHREHSEGGT